jgi:two-component system cell cycle sensor histidine kinase/response regulator CckA
MNKDLKHFDGKQSVSQYHIEHLKRGSLFGHRPEEERRYTMFIIGTTIAILAFWVLDAVVATNFYRTRTFLELLWFYIPEVNLYFRAVGALFIVIIAFLVVRASSATHLDTALRRSSKWLSTTLKSIGSAVIAVDRNGNVIFMNTQAQKMTSWQLERAVGQPLEHICAIDDTTSTTKWDDRFRRVLSEGEPIALTGNEMIQAADGREICIAGNASPIRDEEGKVIGAVLSLHDLTEIKRSEAARMRLATVVDQAPDPIIIIDVDGVVQYVNPGFEHMSGYLSRDLVGNPAPKLKTDRHDDAFYDDIVTTVMNGEIWRGHIHGRTSDGKDCELESIVSPLKDERGDTISFIAVNRDVTREFELQKQLDYSRRMDAIGRLAAGISHDFNNLLTVISGYVDILLATTQLDDQPKQWLRQIRKAGDSATLMIRQLLAFGRREIVDAEIVDPNQCIREVNKMVERLISNHIEFKLDLGDDIGKIRIDPGQLDQVLMNLIVNARDAMPDGGELHIGTERVTISHGDHVGKLEPGEYVKLWVRDTGAGMTQETAEQIFEPFFTTKEHGKGTGLGLATVYGFAQQIHGDIIVQTSVGRGTTFNIYMPTTHAIQAPAVARFGVPETTHGTETILLVEDDVLLRDLSMDVLADHGYEVLQASDGAEAIKVSQNYQLKIDLIVTDLVMPHVDGFELFKALRKQRPDTRALFLTGYAEHPMINEQARRLGDALVRKPFTPQVLLNRVRGILDADSQPAVDETCVAFPGRR